MIPLQQALAAYAAQLSPLPAQTIALVDALHRVLAQDQISLIDLPRFSNSAMDGYAVYAADTVAASEQQPLHLPVIGEMPAARYEDLPTLQAGSCLRIFTGGALPLGADAVIPQELVQRDGRVITLTRPAAAHRNVRHRGSELASGALIAGAGERITPGLLAALAMAGSATVSVRRLPRIAVLSTGDELVPLGQSLAPGQIPESNGPLIAAWLQSQGYPGQRWSLVRDQREAVDAALSEALEKADLVITTGGASVGDHDHIPSAAEAIGMQTVFWKVAQKPGKPLYFGVRDGKALLGFPGNPGAVLIALELHLKTLLDVLAGARSGGPQWLSGQLTTPVQAENDRDRLLRVRMQIAASGQVLLHPLPHQDSHMMSNLRLATALARVPARDSQYEAGEILQWLPLTGLQSC